MSLERIAKILSRDTAALRFAAPVSHVYNPLAYAWAPHQEYLRRFGFEPREVLLLGMNPGPFGMIQTGVPFGEVGYVRDWLGIQGPVGRPEIEHPKRPVDGFACTRSEVSGRRLWGWAERRFGSAPRFFKRFMVWNYCPLSFLESSGRNHTPNKLPVIERKPLFAICDRALVDVVLILKPRIIVGIGQFAAVRAKIALQQSQVVIAQAPHPSPASPMANRGWEPLFEQALITAGITLPA